MSNQPTNQQPAAAVPMISRVWGKATTQQVIRDLRAQGLPVKKIAGGYELKHKKYGVLFKAMNGARGYLVRYRSDLFAAAPAAEGSNA